MYKESQFHRFAIGKHLVIPEHNKTFLKGTGQLAQKCQSERQKFCITGNYMQISRKSNAKHQQQIDLNDLLNTQEKTQGPPGISVVIFEKVIFFVKIRGLQSKQYKDKF